MNDRVIFDYLIFDQQLYQVHDELGHRLIMCECCFNIAPSDSFVDYGGRDRLNYGLCRECFKLGAKR